MMCVLSTEDKGVSFQRDANGAWMSGCTACVHSIEVGTGVEWETGLARVLSRKNDDADEKFSREVDSCYANYNALPADFEMAELPVVAGEDLLPPGRLLSPQLRLRFPKRKLLAPASLPLGLGGWALQNCPPFGGLSFHDVS